MSLALFYQTKADQCARLAEDATDPQKRAIYLDEQKTWLEIAKQIEPVKAKLRDDRAASVSGGQAPVRRSPHVPTLRLRALAESEP